MYRMAPHDGTSAFKFAVTSSTFKSSLAQYSFVKCCISLSLSFVLVYAYPPLMSTQPLALNLAEFRLCQRCLTAKPAEEFRRRHRNGTARMGRCRECHNAAERERRAKRRRKSDGDVIRKWSYRVRHATRDQEIRLLCDATINYFGGVERFAVAWFEHFDQARETRPGSATVLGHFKTVVKLIEHFHLPPPDVSDLSDEDLDRELRDLSRELICSVQISRSTD